MSMPRKLVVQIDPFAADRPPFVRVAPAGLASLLFHGGLFGIFFLLMPAAPADTLEDKHEETVITTEGVEEKNDDPFSATVVNPGGLENWTDPAVDVPLKASVTIPGIVNPLDDPGLNNGSVTGDLISKGMDRGFTLGPGIVGAIDGPGGNVNTNIGPGGAPTGGDNNPLKYRIGTAATRERVMRDGGTGASEAAVARGLQWLARNQFPDGSWRLDGNYPDKGSQNDIAGTAFGLLPMLGAGKTHKASKDNPFDKPVEKGLLFLVRKQDKKTGNFGGGMYGHGLATIALCEAYGLTQDPYLRRPCQLAVNYIVASQHEGGGWRYTPGQAGDTSVTGWQIMALKSAQMAGLDVPELTMKKAIRYLDGCVSPTDEGYGYVGQGSTPTMSAVGLLCRQFVQGWGPRNIRLIKSIDNHLKTNPPGMKRDSYYYYYATQVLYHAGGEGWKKWNEKMRDLLVQSQDSSPQSPQYGSWSSAGDVHGSAGGRLMITSLNLLTLEVYYRHLPLYRREMAAKEEMMGKQAP